MNDDISLQIRTFHAIFTIVFTWSFKKAIVFEGFFVKTLWCFHRPLQRAIVFYRVLAKTFMILHGFYKTPKCFYSSFG